MRITGAGGESTADDVTLEDPKTRDYGTPDDGGLLGDQP
jgi:hypothetical protein